MRKLLAMACLTILGAAPVAAGTFIVTLTSGTSFETRYRPNQSEADENKIFLLTEFGNWISLPKDMVASVQSETESKGFGTVLDSQTIALGWVPNSATPESAADGQGELDPTARLINFLREQNAVPPPPVYNNELIVEPSESSGIPIGFINRQTPPLGNTQFGIEPR